jgi:hypothetical protein
MPEISRKLDNMKPSFEVKSGSKFCVVTAYTQSIQDMGLFTSRVNAEYCKKQGYDFRVYTDGFDLDVHPAWSKLLFVKDALKDYEWVFWIDADAVITNRDIRLENLIQMGGDIFMSHRRMFIGISMGTFLTRQCFFSLKLLDEMWNQRTKLDREDQAVKRLLDGGFIGMHLVCFGMRMLNSIPGETADMAWQPGDFIAHKRGRITQRKKLESLEGCLKQGGVVFDPSIKVSMTLPIDVIRKYPNPIFFETGTFEGGGVATAKRAGFKRIITIDINEELSANAKKKYPGVEAHTGDSKVVFPQVLATLDQPVTFWVDAHSILDGQNSLPLFRELEAIRERWNPKHVVMIDDIQLIRCNTTVWCEHNLANRFFEALTPFIRMGCEIRYEKNLEDVEIMVLKMPGV